MKYLLSILVFFALAIPQAFAYELYVTEVSEPYEIVFIDNDLEQEQKHLGTLEDYPVMYEIEVTDSITLTTSLRQLYRSGQEPVPFSLIVVKKDERGGGVSEVLRFNPGAEDWQKIKDNEMGLTFLDSEVVTERLEKGVYRIEVSTPTNIGNYILNLGEYRKSFGYLDRLSHARAVQKHMGFSIFRMLSVPGVYIPVGIFLFSLGFYRIRKVFNKIDHVA